MKLLSRFGHIILTVLLLGMLTLLLLWLNETHQDVGAEERAFNLARLLDADTAFMVHVPAFEQAHEAIGNAHFTGLGLHRSMGRIALQIVDEFPQLEAWRAQWEHFRSVAPTDVAIAIAPGLERPTFLTVFRSEIPSDALWEMGTNFWGTDPSSPEAREVRDGVTFGRLTNPNGELIRASWEEWHLISNHDETLERALRRLRSSAALPSLASHADFRRSLATLHSDYLVLAYLAGEFPSPGREPLSLPDPVRLGETPENGGHPSESHEENQDQNQPKKGIWTKSEELLDRLRARSVALAVNVQDGQILEETMILAREPSAAPATEAESAPSVVPPHEVTLALTSPRTLAYLTAREGADRLLTFLFDRYRNRWNASNVDALTRHADSWEDHFAPVWALQLEPVEILSETETLAESAPLALVLTFTLHDAAHFKEQLDALAASPASGFRPSGTGTVLLDPALLPSRITNLLGTVHLRVEHGMLMLSDDLRALSQVSRRWEQGQHLAKRPDFQKLLRRLPEPELGLAYVDTEQVIERGRQALQHPLVFATLWMGLRSQTHLEIDFKGLADHSHADLLVLPTLAIWKPVPGGYLQSSRGTLSPAQWLFGCSVLVSTIDKTFLDPVPLQEMDTFAAPALEQELLRMMEP